MTDNSTQRQCLAGSSGAVEKLSRIWSEVLGRPPLTTEQNFFQAGGDPPSAVRLCEQILAEFGKVVPPLALYAVPTTISIAAALTACAPLRFSNALLLKSGSKTAPPVFLFHGLGGNVMEFFDVVQNVDWPNPVYGLQARGSDGFEPPLKSIESMAEYHLEAIRQLQAHGPYLLCGYSLGGLVALELARGLCGSGETVALLAMIDSYPHGSLLPAAERSRLYLQRVQQRLHRAVAPAASKPLSPEQVRAINEKMCGPAISAVTEAAFCALQHYRPKPYSGRVHFVTAQVRTTFPRDPRVAWSGLLPGLTVETVAGTHHGMLQTSAAQLVSVLSRWIEEGLKANSLCRKAG